MAAVAAKGGSKTGGNGTQKRTSAATNLIGTNPALVQFLHALLANLL